jgi:hypothetical protein
LKNPTPCFDKLGMIGFSPDDSQRFLSLALGLSTGVMAFSTGCLA